MAVPNLRNFRKAVLDWIGPTALRRRRKISARLTKRREDMDKRLIEASFVLRELGRELTHGGNPSSTVKTPVPESTLADLAVLRDEANDLSRRVLTVPIKLGFMDRLRRAAAHTQITLLEKDTATLMEAVGAIKRRVRSATDGGRPLP